MKLELNFTCMALLNNKHYIYRATFKELWGLLFLNKAPTKLSLKLKFYLTPELQVFLKKIELLMCVFQSFKFSPQKYWLSFLTQWDIYRRTQEFRSYLFIFYLNTITLGELPDNGRQQNLWLYLNKIYKPSRFQNTRLESNNITKLYTDILYSTAKIYNYKDLLVTNLRYLTWLLKKQQQQTEKLSFHSLFKWNLKRKVTQPLFYNPNNLNFRYTFTRHKLTESLNFFKIYRHFLFLGWDISAYAKNPSKWYTYLKQLLNKYQLPLFSFAEYLLINIIYKANFTQSVYQAKIWILKGFFLLNKNCILNPEQFIKPWSLICPSSLLKIVIYKILLNRLSQDYNLSLKKTKRNIILENTQELNTFWSSIWQKTQKNITLSTSSTNTQTIRMLRTKFLVNRRLLHIFSYEYRNKYKNTILLNYASYLSVTYKCLLICPFRLANPMDFNKIFPSFN